MAKKRTYAGAGGEDSAAISRAYQEGLQEYSRNLAPLSVQDMIMSIGGDKSAFIRELAGISQEGKLPAKGTPERRAYDSQAKNVSRWLAYERGDRGKQARNAEQSKPTQERFKNLYARNNPPSGRMSATITGWIGYDGDWRYRSIEIPPPMGGRGDIDTEAFNAAMAAGDTSAAYGVLFAAYAPGLTVSEATEFNIQYESDE